MPMEGLEKFQREAISINIFCYNSVRETTRVDAQKLLVSLLPQLLRWDKNYDSFLTSHLTAGIEHVEIPPPIQKKFLCI